MNRKTLRICPRLHLTTVRGQITDSQITCVVSARGKEHHLRVKRHPLHPDYRIAKPYQTILLPIRTDHTAVTITWTIHNPPWGGEAWVITHEMDIELQGHLTVGNDDNIVYTTDSRDWAEYTGNAHGVGSSTTGMDPTEWHPASYYCLRDVRINGQHNASGILIKERLSLQGRSELQVERQRIAAERIPVQRPRYDIAVS